MKMPPRVGQEVSRSVETQSQDKTRVYNKLPPIESLVEGETIVYNKDKYVRENGSLRRFKSTDSFDHAEVVELIDMGGLTTALYQAEIAAKLKELITALKTEGVIK